MKINPNIIRNPETTITLVLFNSGKWRLIDLRDIVVEVAKKDGTSATDISGLSPSALGPV